MLCPSPLVSVNSTRLGSYPSYVMLEQAYENCYVPCPNIELTNNEWERLKTTILTLVIISFTTSLVSCMSHVLVDTTKYYTTIMFIGGFCLYSLVLMTFLLLNRQNEQICYDDAAYIERGGLCVTQSAASVFLFLWIEIWSVILAYDSLRQLYSRLSYAKSQEKLHRRYTIIALVSSSVITAVPLIAGVMGYDPKANIPICFFIGSETAISSYFWWNFFLPFYFLLSLCIIITVTGMVRINRVMVLSSLRLQSNAAAAKGVIDTDIRTPLLLSHGQAEEEIGYPAAAAINCSSRYPDIDFDTDIEKDVSFGTLSDHGDDDDEGDSLSIIQDIFRTNNRKGVHKVTSSGSITSMSTDAEPSGARNTDAPPLSSSRSATNAPAGSSWEKYWGVLRLIFKYNSRNIIFVTLFGVSTLSLGPVCINTYYFEYANFINMANEFVDCLVQAGLASPTQTQEAVDALAQQICGLVPASRPHLSTLYCILIWVSSYGIIPAIVYGIAPGSLKAIHDLAGGTHIFFV